MSGSDKRKGRKKQQPYDETLESPFGYGYQYLSDGVYIYVLDDEDSDIEEVILDD